MLRKGQPERGSPPTSASLVHPGPQNIEQCCPQWGLAFPTLFADPRANLWKTPQRSPEAILSSSPGASQDSHLLPQVSHHIPPSQPTSCSRHFKTEARSCQDVQALRDQIPCQLPGFISCQSTADSPQPYTPPSLLLTYATLIPKLGSLPGCSCCLQNLYPS